MPTYLIHGFRWPRPLIRIHIILQNLDDAAAEWLMAPSTTAALISNFRKLHPDTMQHLPDLRFIEQYDPRDESSADAKSQPFAYVADVVHEVQLGVEIDDVRGKGVSNEAWGAIVDLRDAIAPGEKVAWFVVVCGDTERWVPPTVKVLENSSSYYRGQQESGMEAGAGADDVSLCLSNVEPGTNDALEEEIEVLETIQPQEERKTTSKITKVCQLIQVKHPISNHHSSKPSLNNISTISPPPTAPPAALPKQNQPYKPQNGIQTPPTSTSPPIQSPTRPSTQSTPQRNGHYQPQPLSHQPSHHPAHAAPTTTTTGPTKVLPKPPTNPKSDSSPTSSTSTSTTLPIRPAAPPTPSPPTTATNNGTPKTNNDPTTTTNEKSTVQASESATAAAPPSSTTLPSPTTTTTAAAQG
jgi:hypothetical protein